jgi:hypothetical protein
LPRLKAGLFLIDKKYPSSPADNLAVLIAGPGGLQGIANFHNSYLTDGAASED